MSYNFKITDGCTKTGHNIACNVTQDAPAFSTNIPSAHQRAKEGMAAHAAHRSDEAAFRRAKAMEKQQPRTTSKRFLSDEEVEG
ncbi:MAG: hypothetical protein ABJ360_19755 [Roseobacter sp.]